MGLCLSGVDTLCVWGGVKALARSHWAGAGRLVGRVGGIKEPVGRPREVCFQPQESPTGSKGVCSAAAEEAEETWGGRPGGGGWGGWGLVRGLGDGGAEKGAGGVYSVEGVTGALQDGEEGQWLCPQELGWGWGGATPEGNGSLGR